MSLKGYAMDEKAKPANPPQAADAYTQYHEVQKGDTLGKIAEKYYGDSSLYKTIFEANKDQLKDPNKIFPGQKLRIP
jgi:nucleoid-associated protein YgaU